MTLRIFSLCCSALIVCSQSASALDADEINRALFTVRAPTKEPQNIVPDPAIVKAQIILDRLRISPGVIDGYDGENFRKALTELRRVRSLPEADGLDEATWAALQADVVQDVVTTYEVTERDEDYDFKPTPKDYAKLARQKRIGYRAPAEMIGERFHMDEKLLQLLNPKFKTLRAGDKILVAAVRPPEPDPPAKQPKKKRSEKPDKPLATRIVVSISLGRVSAIDEGGKLLASYPATVGSEDTPTPPGSYSVRRVVKNPTYSYDPDKNFKQGKNAKKLTLPAGPNGPVGTVWIALSKPTFGIHGTAEPSKVSKTESHGCVRLTNWDAEHLAAIAGPGSAVEFVE